MNWELFNVGDDVSRVILELEANLQLLNNDAVVVGFANLYFSAMREDLKAKAKCIKENDDLVDSIAQEYDQTEDEDQKTLLVNRQKAVLQDNETKYKEFRVSRYYSYKQAVFFEKEKTKILEEIRVPLKKIKIDFSCINLLKIAAVEVAYAIQIKDFQLVEKLAFKLQKIIMPQLTDMLAFKGIDVMSKEGRKKMMEAFPNMIDFLNFFIENHLHPLKDSKDYDFYFALSIRQTPLQKLDQFFSFQRDHFEGDFNNFLKLVLLEYETLLNPSHVVILKEWIKENPQEFKSTISWTDGNKKVNFIKMVYALHANKIINNGQGTFDSVLKDFSNLVNLKLNSNPLANMSNEKHKRNADYNPYDFFESLQTTYQKYIDKDD